MEGSPACRIAEGWMRGLPYRPNEQTVSLHDNNYEGTEVTAW
jgi:hypothetical protein